nr:hypothetical protein [Micromonospora sp. NBC_01699]
MGDPLSLRRGCAEKLPELLRQPHAGHAVGTESAGFAGLEAQRDRHSPAQHIAVAPMHVVGTDHRLCTRETRRAFDAGGDGPGGDDANRPGDEQDGRGDRQPDTERRVHGIGDSVGDSGETKRGDRRCTAESVEAAGVMLG